MVQTIPARDISLYELEEKFGLQLATDTSFFPEWTENLPTLTDGEKLHRASKKQLFKFD
jgi:hypothetical protein